MILLAKKDAVKRGNTCERIRIRRKNSAGRRFRTVIGLTHPRYIGVV
jgi:hypothetical protein